MGKSERDPILVAIGERIAKERGILGCSQEKLGELSGHSKQSISNAETGGKELRVKTILGLGEALGTSYDYLLTGKQNEIDLKYLDDRLLDITETQFRILKKIINFFLETCDEGKI